MGQLWHKGSGMSLAGLVCVASLTVTIIFFSPVGEGPQLDTKMRLVLLTVLVLGFLAEVCDLVGSALKRHIRSVRLGPSGEQLLGKLSPVSPLLLVGNLIMCVEYAILLSTYGTLFFRWAPCFHMDPVSNRPVNTLRFLEWSVAVPGLMFLVGYVLLEQPMELVVPPIIRTATYIWLAWCGMMCFPTWARALLISTSFTMFAKVSVEQWRWRHERPSPSQPSPGLASLAILLQIISFLCYGAVYLAALGSFLSPETEEIFYTVLDVIVKNLHSGLIILIKRGGEVELLFSSTRQYLDAMVDLRALVAAKFDVLIHCRISSQGLLISESLPVLERLTGKVLQDQPLTDICCLEEDRQRLRRHRMSHPSPARSVSNPDHHGMQQQQSGQQIADALRVDLIWVGAPNGCVPAEFFLAHSAATGMMGDLVLIGLRLCQAEGDRGSLLVPT